jgi:hypothetical protein
VAFELDPTVCQLTRQNLAAIGSPIELVNTDYRTGIASTRALAGQLLIAFVAPPWGDALSAVSGLDLRRTTPPVREIVELLVDSFGQQQLLCAIQVYERVDQASLAELDAYFDWSMMRMYGLNAAGQNHGVLLGARGF